MRYLFIMIVCALVWMFVPMPQPALAGTQPVSGIDSTMAVGQMSQRQLAMWIFSANDATMDSARVWLAEHQSVPDSTMTDSVLIAELLSTVRARLRSLYEQHQKRNAPAAPPSPF